MQDVRSVAQLAELIEAGEEPTYLMFWGHQKSASAVGKECLSQWWPATFTLDGVTYPSAEHYMMARKARLFGDDQAAERIRLAPHPGAAKALGRRVAGFDELIWTEHRFEIVVTGNLAKFGQNDELLQFLLATGGRVLVEASPVDRIWGIGLAASDDRAQRPASWGGLNLLGFALMEVRHRLARSGSDGS